MTGKKVPDVKSLIDDAAAFRRNIDFGVKTTIGRRFGFAAWKRSRWKYEAGVDGCATVIFFSAQSARNRSIRADE